MSFIVLKLGGSLIQSKELSFWLENIFSKQKKSICIVVPGGSVFAESIRISQTYFNFSNEIAHKMAILAMTQYGYYLTGMNKDINIIENVEELEEIKEIKQIKVSNNSFLWLPNNTSDVDIKLPKTWAFTSDSIALWLAIFLKADKLIIVKSKKIKFDKSNIGIHIKENDIDEGFESLIKNYKGQLIFLDKTQYNTLKEII